MQLASKKRQVNEDGTEGTEEKRAKHASSKEEMSSEEIDAVHEKMVTERSMHDGMIKGNCAAGEFKITISGPEGPRTIILPIDPTFYSGEATDPDILIDRLVDNEIIENSGEYDAQRHAHSEQHLCLHLEDNCKQIAQDVSNLMVLGEDFVCGFTLHLNSIPNSVCKPCHQHVDYVLTNFVIPEIEEMNAEFTSEIGEEAEEYAVRQAQVAVVYEEDFPGSGSRSSDGCIWVEHKFNFKAAAKEKKVKADNSKRDERARKRAERG